MKLATLACAALLVAASPSLAAPCTSVTDLGSMGPPGLELLGNSFTTAGAFNDCYRFSIDESASSFGGVLEFDVLLNKLDIDVTSISLSGGALTETLVDDTPLTFSFLDLLAGDYELTVTGLVSRDPGLWETPVGYAGKIVTLWSDAEAVQAIPEPGTLSMLGFGLAGLAAFARRRKQA